MAQMRAPRMRRVWLPAAVLGVFGLIVVLRLAQIQVINHDKYAAQARDELYDSSTLLAQRGSLLDRNGYALATSVETWDLYISTRSWRENTVAVPAAEVLAPALDRDPAELIAQVRASESVDELVARDVNYVTGLDLLSGGVTGLIALPNSARSHPEGDTGASILGIIGQDNQGLAGIEAAYDSMLSGTPGQLIYERDTTGDPIPLAQIIARDPVSGSDIVMTIDRYLQRLAEQTLADAIAEHQAKGGAVIMMDPDSGEILAMATTPSLEYGSLVTDGDDILELLRNRAVSDLYEPGSVMKVVTAAAAIDAGVVTPNTTYVDTGVVDIDGTPIYNWDFNTYGEQTMTGVLQQSINTGAVFMAERLGAEQFHRYITAFGFGHPTGIDLTGEASGILRKPDDAGWSPVDLATQSFGQSISVTPVQMISAVAAAINGGVLYRPHLVKATVAPNGQMVHVQPEVIDRPISEETSATVREMLGAVIGNSGYHPAEPKNYRAGGKSGTANVPIPNGYDDTQIASFVGFAPLDNPQILILVKLDENADFLTGTAAAGPVVASLIDESLAYMNVPHTFAFVEAR